VLAKENVTQAAPVNVTLTQANVTLVQQNISTAPTEAK